MSDLAATDLPGPAAPGSVDLELRLEAHRRELIAYSYRMLGSGFEAEDAVQETMVRAWRSFDRFEGRSTLRSWLYRIATNVCLDMLKGRERRARPMELTTMGTAAGPLGEPRGEVTWLQPYPDARLLPEDGDPAETAVLRESVQLAFLAVLQHLPPRQRVVLILREVLQWTASEVANLLDTTVASVNSALQRARATLTEHRATLADVSGEPGEQNEGTIEPIGQATDDEQQLLLDRYVDAFERYDMAGLVSVLHADATLSMPPYDLWMRGPEQIRAWMLGIGHECRGSRLIPTQANGSAAFGQYRRSPDGGYEPWALQVIEVAEGRVVGLNSFLQTATLFPLFGLPARLDD
jgi:RNA polymerase sigma-70 factor (ECF subfamily)